MQGLATCTCVENVTPRSTSRVPINLVAEQGSNGTPMSSADSLTCPLQNTIQTFVQCIVVLHPEFLTLGPAPGHRLCRAG